MTTAALVPLAGPALLHALRLLPLALVSPFLGGPLVPAPIRVALALGLGTAVSAWSACGAPSPSDALGWAGAAGRELALGVAFAFLASVPVEAARAAGRLVDTFRGATLAELHVAPIRQNETASGDLLAQWVVVLAAWTGGHRLLLQGLLGSFGAIPAGASFSLLAARESALHAAGELLGAAVAVAAPAAAAVLAADLALALAARVAPQLGVVNAAQPARAAVGLLVLAVAAATCVTRLVTLVALSQDVAASWRTP